ncbi:hypothetical protein DNTS_004485 [Danionella cerebrum]|uniref:Uncharacterized protein n=1 Tax=Danionella cerebrum TaxID=2873325 RepID=A0A553QQC5_9TELE|nr:hypothetical protein DNTS_004485 [Danionella translucida]
MESMVRKSLLTPVKTFKLCVTGAEPEYAKGQEPKIKRKPQSRGQRKSLKSRTPWVTHTQDPNLLRSYQSELDKQRKLREAMNAQKNAERAAMRAHFRRKYNLRQDARDSARLQSMGGRVQLSSDLARMVQGAAPKKDPSSNLIRAFQSLGLSGSNNNRGKHTQTPSTEPCRVM